MKNRINELFERKNQNILSVFYTAGYPELNDTVTILELLEQNGVDMAEIGMPFSDPTADGPVIQQSSHQALKNGMSVEKLFSQLKDIRSKVQMPLILMGYFNPVLQYGVDSFCRKCRETGIDGVILPDLPPEEYNAHYRRHFEENNLHFILLITPQTSMERIREIDRQSEGFIYMVSSSSTTGSSVKEADSQTEYFERIKNMNLKNPLLTGFGISDRESFQHACQYAHGAIVGSTFIRSLSHTYTLEEIIKHFTKSLKPIK
jgi:tryptophan synthase alpha chain